MSEKMYGEDRPKWLDIADAGPDLGEPEWDDARVPILEEPPFVTELRRMEGGPWYLMPDSGEQVPTDFYADIDSRALEDAIKFAKKRPAKAFTPDGKAAIPANVRELLENGGYAAQALLETLERGLDAATPSET